MATESEESGREPSREELAAAMAANAARKPFNIAVLVVVVGVALALGAPVPVAAVAGLLLYTAAAARTLFDAGEAARVEARRRAKR
jgi:hypothetical protein